MDGCARETLSYQIASTCKIIYCTILFIENDGTSFFLRKLDIRTMALYKPNTTLKFVSSANR